MNELLSTMGLDERDPVGDIERRSAGRLLTGEEEQALGYLWREARHRDAVETLVLRRNSRLIWRQVNRLRCPPGMEPSDLWQEGAIALLYAWGKWEPERGLKFSTYAVTAVRQRVQRAAVNLGTLVRLPVHMGERVQRVLEVQRQLALTLGREPTYAEVGAVVGLGAHLVADVFRHVVISSPCSLDDVVSVTNTGDRERHEVVADDVDVAASAYASAAASELRTWLARLPERQRQILVWRYWNSETLEQIGKRLGITRERVRQLEDMGVCQLRELARAEQDHAAAAAD